MSEQEQPPVNDLQPNAIPHRRFVVLPTDPELSSPEGNAKMINAREMVRHTFPENVLNSVEYRAQVDATIDIMATALVSTGIIYGEGDDPEDKLGRIYRENPWDMLSSIPMMYHNKIGTRDAMLGAQYVHEKQEAREPNYFTIPERLMLGLVSAGDDWVFKGRRVLDELESAETIAALMRNSGAFNGELEYMIEGVSACTASSVFTERKGYNEEVKRVLSILRGIDPEDFPAESQDFVDSLNKIHKTGTDGDLIILATRDSARRGMLHEMEGLWRIIRRIEARAGIVEDSTDYFHDQKRAHEDLRIRDIIEFIDANSDYRIMLGNALIRNAGFVRTHQYEDSSLNDDLLSRKGVNAKAQEELGKAIVEGSMSVEDAYTIATKYADSESQTLVLTPEEDVPSIVDGKRMPAWSELIPTMRSS